MTTNGICSETYGCDRAHTYFTAETCELTASTGDVICTIRQHQVRWRDCMAGSGVLRRRAYSGPKYVPHESPKVAVYTVSTPPVCRVLLPRWPGPAWPRWVLCRRNTSRLSAQARRA